MVVRAYEGVLRLAAGAGAVLLAAVFVAIIYDVTVRTLGAQPPAWTAAFSEYAMLYATLLAAPWLVGRRGHVAVESLVLFLPERARRWIQRLAYLLCIVVSLLLAAYAGELTFQTYLRGELDIRAVEVPRWLLFAVIPPSFALIAVEFARLLVANRAHAEDRTRVNEGL